MLMQRSTLAKLDELSRSRPLDDAEVKRLAWAIDRDERKNGGRDKRWYRYWTNGDDRRLVAYLNRGKKPAMIAILMDRTERSIWRRIYRLGLGVRKAKSSIASRAAK